MKTILSILLLIFVQTTLLFAQPPPSLPGAPTQAPIDGGLSILALAGGAYVLKKMKATK